MPELHVVNYGHSTPCTNCWELRCLDLRMETNCDLLAWGLTEIDEQTNVDTQSYLISRERYIVYCHVIARQISSYLPLKIYLPWLSNDTIWTVVTRTTTLSQTSFSHISINSSSILTVSMATESPWKDLLIDTSHVLRRSIMAKILGRSTGNHHGTVY